MDMKACYPFFDIFIACTGHTFSQARQKIQSGSRAINGFFSEDGFPANSAHSYTFTGHASIQAPSPTQISKSTETYSPQIPNTSLPFLGPKILILFPLEVAVNVSLTFSFVLNATSIGPSFAPLLISGSSSTCAVCPGGGEVGFGFGFAFGTICARGVIASNSFRAFSLERFFVL